MQSQGGDVGVVARIGDPTHQGGEAGVEVLEAPPSMQGPSESKAGNRERFVVGSRAPGLGEVRQLAARVLVLGCPLGRSQPGPADSRRAREVLSFDEVLQSALCIGGIASVVQPL